jgi:hypothetical protein
MDTAQRADPARPKGPPKPPVRKRQQLGDSDEDGDDYPIAIGLRRCRFSGQFRPPKPGDPPAQLMIWN